MGGVWALGLLLYACAAMPACKSSNGVTAATGPGSCCGWSSLAGVAMRTSEFVQTACWLRLFGAGVAQQLLVNYVFSFHATRPTAAMVCSMQ